MNKEYTTNSPEETKKVAQEIAAKLKGGEVVGLIGNLGAGKTVFVQGLAEALGIKEVVNSPTFVLMKNYTVKNLKSNIRELVHIDTYRLTDSEELMDIGLADYFNRADTVVVIEWADKVKDILPSEVIYLDFQEGEAENSRRIILTK